MLETDEDDEIEHSNLNAMEYLDLIISKNKDPKISKMLQEDEHLQASDASLDSKLTLFRSVRNTSERLLTCIENYQTFLLAVMRFHMAAKISTISRTISPIACRIVYKKEPGKAVIAHSFAFFNACWTLEIR
ncbi:unnamed protein product [Heligmosomoides polygyrus]|uniref:Component of oligomeric Golgi complex 2 n=1 Tax=Heligmosomoides polygyrus TaxID=6339 RepID=A0A183GK29_HELPZ|nr:unnamed protein product [Heligmosomoides polygyrus]